MKKDNMINYLIKDGEFTEKELTKLKVAKVQALFNERFEVEEEDEDFSKGLEYGEDYINDPTIERELMEKHDIEHIRDPEIEKELMENYGIDAEAELTRILEEELKRAEEEIVEEEVIEIDLKSLSPVERRAYARTGVIPVIRVNRYTRFDDENPKMNN